MDLAQKKGSYSCKQNSKKIDKPPPLSPVSDEDTLKHMVCVIMVSRYSLRKGIELFGGKAVKATSAGLGKIHSVGTYKPMDAT